LKLKEVYEYPNKVHVYEGTSDLNLGDIVNMNIQEGKFMSINEVCTIMHKLTASLAYLHSKNIVFRNLKPENILFTREGDYSSLKLCNFEYAFVNQSNCGIEPDCEGEYY